MSSDITKVIIVGAGIAGPILAILLKQRGYDPIVHERLPEFNTAGLSLALQPNGLRLLNQIPGFVANIPGKIIKQLTSYSTLPTDPGLLHITDFPSRMPELYGFPMIAVSRPKFHKYIIDQAEAHGIKMQWGHSVVGVDQSEDKVKVIFENGESDEASWVLGCDGLHSGTRKALFGKEAADYTGVSQTGGLSPTPANLVSTPQMANFYGLGSHMIAYPVSDTHTSWALTLPEEVLQETWQAVSKDKLEAFQKTPYAKWNDGAGELIMTTEKLIKYGLYDRPELKTWHKGRVVLLGDAAHPTSPHLGQGANQAFEDVSKILELLDAHNPTRTPPSTSTLKTIFEEYESIRISTTSEMVQGARHRGEMRVMHSEDKCEERNETIRHHGDQGMQNLYKKLYPEEAEKAPALP